MSKWTRDGTIKSCATERLYEEISQLLFICSNSTRETVEKGVKYIQS